MARCQVTDLAGDNEGGEWAAEKQNWQSMATRVLDGGSDPLL